MARFAPAAVTSGPADPIRSTTRETPPRLWKRLPTGSRDEAVKNCSGGTSGLKLMEDLFDFELPVLAGKLAILFKKTNMFNFNYMCRRRPAMQKVAADCNNC